MDSMCFHVGDVLTVATERMVSPGRMHGLCDILHFMAGEEPAYHQVPRFMGECRKAILRQYPQFALPNFARAQSRLDQIIRSCSQVTERIYEWLLEIMSGHYGFTLPLCGQFGDMLEVRRLPPYAHVRKSAAYELLEMQALYA
jgi:hypothetical protein